MPCPILSMALLSWCHLLYAEALFMAPQALPPGEPRLAALLADAEQGYRIAGNRAGLGSVLSARVILASFQGQFALAFRLSAEALTLLPAEDVKFRGHCLAAQGIEALLSGEVELVRARFQ